MVTSISYHRFMQIADVWSCGVTLYVMLVGAYPFEDIHDPRNFRKTINVSSCERKKIIIIHNFKFHSPSLIGFRLSKQRILSVQYSIPDYVRVSPGCRHLLSRIFVANPYKVCLFFFFQNLFIFLLAY